MNEERPDRITRDLIREQVETNEIEPGLETEDGPNPPVQATPLVKTGDNRYMGPLRSPLLLEVNIRGGHRGGKTGLAAHIIDSILERYGDDRPVQVDYAVGDTLMHSKKYIQTATTSRESAPILTLKITEDNE